MTVSVNAQAVLLLTAYFTNAQTGAAKPLTPMEWGRFAEWLKSQSLTPERLLNGDLSSLLQSWRDKSVSIERLAALLDRGSALALSMEKWLRSGLWVMTRSDPDYPKRLKQRLRGDSPAVLFGCGNRTLLNKGGLAVIGSRNANDGDLAYSRQLGALAAKTGHSIVSGGARGVDEAAMLGALEAEGTAVGVLADSLLRACSSAKYRRYLSGNNLVLISPFNPDAGFNAGNAMQRNKYIYCLADAALAVHSGKKGGTWSGAIENLKKCWVPLWVKPTDDPEAGNAYLIAEGAARAPADIDSIDIESLFTLSDYKPDSGEDLFSQNSAAMKEENIAYTGSDGPDSYEEESAKDEFVQTEEISDAQVANGVDEARGGAGSADLSQLSFYQLFLDKVRQACSDKPRTTDELIELLHLNKTQLDCWLKQAVAERKLKKLPKPVRYQWTGDNQGLLPFE